MKNKFLTGLMRWGSVEGKMSYFQPYAGFLKELSRAKRLRKGTVWAGKSHFTPAMLPSASSLILTWLLAVPLLWGGCDKPNDCPELKLPPLTTEGLNTFGCVIDGEVWVPHVDWQLIQTPLDFGEITVVHSEDDNRFFIRVDRRPNQNCDTTDQVIQLSISLDSLNKGWLNYSSDFSDWNTGRWQYRPDTTVSRVVDIHKFDPIQRILSGTFSFDFLHEPSGEAIEVRDGRFDLKF